MKEHLPTIKPGHPEYLPPAKDGEIYCQGNFMLSRRSVNYYCTRANNHTGDHTAHDGVEILCQWSDKEGSHDNSEDRVNDIAYGHYDYD